METVSLGHCASDTWITRNCPGRNCEVPDEQSKTTLKVCLWSFLQPCPEQNIYTQSAKNGTYGDQITLQTTADLYNIEIAVVSTLRHDATMVISPSSSIPTARVQLGHMCG